MYCSDFNSVFIFMNTLQRIALLGWGVTGQSIARFFADKGVAIVVLAPSTQWPSHHDPNISFVNTWPDYAFNVCFVSPGVRLEHPDLLAMKAHDVPVYTDIDWFVQTIQQPLIAVTGSNGKSAVVHALGKWFSEYLAVGGNLGPAALDILDRSVEAYVLELSSFQLVHSSLLAPQVAVVLSIESDHLDWHGSLSAYVLAKTDWLSQATQVVCNAEDMHLVAWGKANPQASITWFYPSRGEVVGSPDWSAWVAKKCTSCINSHCCDCGGLFLANASIPKDPVATIATSLCVIRVIRWTILV